MTTQPSDAPTGGRGGAVIHLGDCLDALPTARQLGCCPGRGVDRPAARRHVGRCSNAEQGRGGVVSETAATYEARAWLGVCIRCGTARQEPGVCRLCDKDTRGGVVTHPQTCTGKAVKGPQRDERARSGIRGHFDGSDASQATTARQTVTIEMPHPPASLSPNGRAHWRVKARDAKQVRHDAAMLTRQAIWDAGIDSHPWFAARLDICWRFAGTRPDDDNVVSRVKAARDGIADACLVSNDVSIGLGEVTFQRVKRAEQCVVLTLTRREDG